MGGCSSQTLGAFSDETRREIENDTNILCVEQMHCLMICRKFRSHFFSSQWGRFHQTGSLAVTDQRLVFLAEGWHRGHKFSQMVDQPLTDERWSRVTFAIHPPTPKTQTTVLVIQYDAGLFQPSWSGSMELQFTTERAQEILHRIRSK